MSRRETWCKEKIEHRPNSGKSYCSNCLECKSLLSSKNIYFKKTLFIIHKTLTEKEHMIISIGIVKDLTGIVTKVHFLVDTLLLLLTFVKQKHWLSPLFPLSLRWFSEMGSTWSKCLCLKLIKKWIRAWLWYSSWFCKTSFKAWDIKYVDYTKDIRCRRLVGWWGSYPEKNQN